MHSTRPHSGVNGVDELVENHTFFVINGGSLTPDELTVRRGGNIFEFKFYPVL